MKEKKSGRIRVSIQQSVWENGRSHTKNHCCLGYLDELDKLHGDGRAFAKQEAARLTEEVRQSRTAVSNISIPVVKDEIVNPGKTGKVNKLKNLGCIVFEKYFRILSLDRKMQYIDGKYRNEFSSSDILLLLILGRIILPDSKKGTWENRDVFFGDFDFSLADIYRSLDILAENKNEILGFVNNKVDAYTNRSKSLLYYDVTNYYFEIEDEDDFRKYGCSKENRPNPIVQLGLFMCENGLPLYFKTFEGNRNDVQTILPAIDEMKRETSCSESNVIYVADKGIMSGDNIAHIRASQNGYVISDSVRKASEDMKKTILRQDDYKLVYEEDADEVVFKYKELDLPVAKRFRDRENNGKTAHVNERVIIFWSRKYQQRSRMERAKAIEKAQDFAENPEKMTSGIKGSRSYVKITPVNNDTGEKGNCSYVSEIDGEKIAEEESLDGYYIIRTNVIGMENGEEPEGKAPYYRSDGYLVLDREVSALDIIEIYRGLWKIEESFKITKSELVSRPVYVRKKEHIEAHFLICFLSLLFIRLLEMETRDSGITLPKALESLRRCNYVKLDCKEEIYEYTYADRVLMEIYKRTKMMLCYKHITKSKIREIKGEINKMRV